MTHQVFNRRYRSLKDSDIDGIFYGSPTWDETSAHWNGLADPMRDSVFTVGAGHEIDVLPTWHFWGIPLLFYVGSIQSMRLESKRRFTTGPGHPVEPTRTPWASFWRPDADDENWLIIWCWNGDREKHMFLEEYTMNSPRAPYHDTFHGPCECGAWHELPDVKKENLQ